MESEKVKEIKDCLDCCRGRDCKTCLRLNLLPRQEEDCRLALIDEALTLINKLESENEHLNKINNEKSLNEFSFAKKIVEENKQFKDQIAKLEKELKEYKDKCELIYDLGFDYDSSKKQ